MRPDLTHVVLAEMEEALAAHLDWLQRWHRAVICGLTPEREVLSENAHFLCRFGGWYELNRERGLVDQPAIHTLGRVHRELHDYGRWLALKATDKDQVLPAEYDRLSEKIRAFQDQGRRICGAFRTALSELDPLTGVYNRQNLSAVVERERERFLRTGVSCSLAIADLDHFKRINDDHGHAAGDRVLCAVASSFLARLRPYDTVFRYGGEEFLICLPDAAGDVAWQILERLREDLAATPVDLECGGRLTVTASFGLAEMTAESPLKEIVRQADQALYEAKRTGRNRIVTWTTDQRFVESRATA